MASTIQVRVDNDLQTKSDFLFEDLGAAEETNPYAPMTGEEMLIKLRKSKEQENYRDVDEVISDMRARYGL